MNEKEAYEQWYANYKRHLPNRPTAKHGWQAGVEWQKAQAAEPVAEITQDGKLKLLNVSALDFGTKLYTHPTTDAVRKLVEAAEFCRFALEPYDDIKPRDWKSDRENLRRAHQNINAALDAVRRSDG